MFTRISSIALVLNAVAVLGQSVLNSTCSSSQPNTDYPGNDIKSTAQASASSCCNDCANTPGCKLYVWTDYNGGTCWLKNANGPPATKNGASAAFVGTSTTTTAPTTCLNIQPNTDYPGNDIKSTARVSASSCCNDCTNTLGCQLYVWTDYNGGTCWLKSANRAPVNKAGAQAGFIPTVTCAHKYANIDYPGNDLKSTSQPSPDKCCDDCGKQRYCTVYVWTKDNGGTCWLKHKASTPVKKDGALAGYRYQALSCGQPIQNTDFTGQDVANVPGSTMGDCCAACLKLKQCNAYSLWNNTCWLKSGSNNPHPADGVTAGTVNKCQPPEQDIDYPGNDLSNAPSATASGCCTICRNTNGCKAYSWFQGTCYLKGEISASRTNKAGVVSAYLDFGYDM